MIGEKRHRKGRAGRRSQQLSNAKLDLLVDEATVDTYNDDEQAMGLFTLIEEHLALPFETAILGVAVTVEQDRCGAARSASQLPSHPRPRRSPRPHPGARSLGPRHQKGGRVDAHRWSRRSGPFHSERDIPAERGPQSGTNNGSRQGGSAGPRS
jgi:hypothetical protein